MKAISRRSFVIGGTSIALAGLAGCGGAGSTGSTSSTEDKKEDSKKALIKKMDDKYGSTILGASVYTDKELQHAFLAIDDDYRASVYQWSYLQKDSSWDEIPDQEINGDIASSDYEYNEELTKMLKAKKSVRDDLIENLKLAHDAFQQSMYDPDSAKFSDMSIAKYYMNDFDELNVMHPDADNTISGVGYIAKFSVNGKNRLGGYVGAQDWFVYSSNDHWDEANDDDNPHEFEHLNYAIGNISERVPWLYTEADESDLK